MALAGCGEPARLTGPLSDEQTHARFLACNRLFDLADGFDVMPFPGGGGVRPEKWGELSPAERSQMLDLAACLQSGGRVGRFEVKLIDAYTRETFIKRHVANDRDFAAMVS